MIFVFIDCLLVNSQLICTFAQIINYKRTKTNEEFYRRIALARYDSGYNA